MWATSPQAKGAAQRSGCPRAVDGRAAAVLVSPAAFDALSERVRFLEAIAQGMDDADAGRLVDHQSMVAESRTRYGAPDE